MTQKSDFILLTRHDDTEILINISQISFIAEGVRGHCHFYFSGEGDDFISIKVGLEEFLDLI